VDDADLLEHGGKQGVDRLPSENHDRGDDRILDEHSGREENRAVADAREARHEKVGAQLEPPAARRQLLGKHRGPHVRYMRFHVASGDDVEQDQRGQKPREVLREVSVWRFIGARK
jgi:hypothetical protein